MKTFSPQSASLDGILLCIVILVGASCAGDRNEPGEQHSNVDLSIKQQKPAAGIAIPGFEELGSPTARRKQDVLAKFGVPATEEKAGAQMQYEILAYPVRGWEEKLLMLFYGEELLGFARQSSRSALDSTVQQHQRVQGGRVILYQSWSNGQTTYYIATKEQLDTAPKIRLTAGEPFPLSQKQAEKLAAEWLQRTSPNSSGEPKSGELMEVKGIPGAAFYVVNLGVFNPPGNLLKVVVLMDGTVLTGELEEP